MKTALNFLVFIFVGVSAFAIDRFGIPAFDLRPGEYVEGKLVSVKYVPGDKETSFYIVGKQAAKIKVDQLKIQLVLDPEGKSQSFVLKRKNDSFIFDQKITKDSRLEIQSEDGQVEHMRIKSKP